MKNVEYCNVRMREELKIEDFERQEQIMEVLANKARLARLYVLEKYGELCTCEIVPLLKMAQPTVTLHLQKLYKAGLLKKRKNTYYSINDEYLEFIRIVLGLKKQNNQQLMLYYISDCFETSMVMPWKSSQIFMRIS